MRPKGNEVLLRMAAYDPMNEELFDFLRSENLISEPEPSPTLTEPEAPVNADETSVEFNPELTGTEQTETLDDLEFPEEEAQPARAIEDDTVLTEVQKMWDEEEEVPGASQTPVSEDTETIELSLEPQQQEEPAIIFDEDEQEILPQEEQAAVGDSQGEATQMAQEEAPILDEELPTDASKTNEIENVVEELFTEDEPAVEMEPVQGGNSLELEDITGLTSESEKLQDDFERNNIDENLSEGTAFSKPLDLEQFDNTEDDFSTLIEGYFQEPDSEVALSEDNEAEQKEPEQPVEERSFLDTSVIFREKRSQDQEPEESLPPEVVEDMNKVADEIEMMSTQVSFKVENEIEKAAELPSESQQEEKEAADSGDLDKVIERLDTAREQQSPLPKPSKELPDLNGDEEVNIDDILKNPSLLTPTFGEILIAQKKFKDAREVFAVLASREPDSERFQKKIKFLDKIVAMQ